MNRILTVIPVYNGERFLRATLESIARQTARPDRLVVIDDCSTDGTRELVRNFSEFPCELVQNPKNLGLFGNLNRALEFASEAEYFHLMLADDLVSPSFLEKTSSALQGIAGRCMAWTLTERIDKEGNRLPGDPPVPPPQPPRRVPLNEFLLRQSELNTILCGSILLKTRGERSPVMFRMDMPQTADCVFYGEWAAQSAELVEVREVLCQIRYHPYSATSQNVKRLESWVLDEWKAMELVSRLIKESGIKKWVHRNRLKCIFAARSYVKVQMTRQSAPEYAKQIRAATLNIVRPYHWWLGRLAVYLRDTFKPAAKPI